MSEATLCEGDMRVGDTYPTKNGKCRVIRVCTNDKITIRFLATGHTRTCKKINLQQQKVKDPLHPSVEGHGFIGVGPYLTTVGGVAQPEYVLWQNMLKRCYSAQFLAKHPTYNGCTVHGRWLNYQNFAKDVSRWPGFNTPGFHLDKDLRVPGNTVYSRETCSFIPAEINTLISEKSTKRALPTGVYATRTRFCAKLKVANKSQHLGSYATVAEAQAAYQRAKALHLKKCATLYRAQLRSQVYRTLMRYAD